MREQKECGFTLVEVLMSMLIFSTAILGLLKISTENIKNTGVLEQKQIAGMIADNVLIVETSGIPKARLNDPAFKKMGGREWRWQVIREATGRKNFVKIKVQVREKGQDQIVLERFAIIREAGTETGS